MKTRIATLTIIAGMISMTACQKQNDTNDTEAADDVMTSTRGSEATAVEELYVGTDCTYDWPATFGSCATVTESSVDFPKTVTINFGTEGCEGIYGHVKKGQIVIEVTDDIRNEGAVRTITFVDFSIDEVSIEGSRTATNIGLSTDGFILIAVSGDFEATKGDYTRTHSFDRQREWILGSETCDWSDDEFLVTGSGTTTGKHGKTITHTIIDPLHIAPGTCEYILSGTCEIKRGTRGGSMDWGTGGCDNAATFTTFSGKVYDVDLDEHKIIH